MFVIAGYIIANRPIGTPGEMRFGTVASKVPAAMALVESIGGVRAKSETDSRFPMAMPITMLDSTKNGRSRKSSSLARSLAVIGSRRPRAWSGSDDLAGRRAKARSGWCSHPYCGTVSLWNEATRWSLHRSTKQERQWLRAAVVSPSRAHSWQIISTTSGSDGNVSSPDEHHTNE